MNGANYIIESQENPYEKKYIFKQIDDLMFINCSCRYNK